MIIKEKYCGRVKTKISHVLSLKTIDFKLYKEIFLLRLQSKLLL